MHTLACALALLLLSSVPVSSSPYVFQFGGGFDFESYWDTVTASISDGSNPEASLIFRLTLDGGLYQGVQTFEDGDLGALARSLTTYNGGIARADFYLDVDASLEFVGSYQAPIEKIVFDINEGCRFLSKPCGDAYVTLGRGLLDPKLAKLLGVGSRMTRGGTYDVFLEDIPPFDEFAAGLPRMGDWNGSRLQFEVPEPTVLMLLSLAMGCAIRRRASSAYARPRNMPPVLTAPASICASASSVPSTIRPLAGASPEVPQ